MGAEQFKMMKKTAYLINTSRGELVNEKDLLLCLKNDTLTGAAIDVVSNEFDNRFRSNPIANDLVKYSLKNNNLIITPHMAGLTFESEKKAFMISVNNIINYF